MSVVVDLGNIKIGTSVSDFYSSYPPTSPLSRCASAGFAPKPPRGASPDSQPAVEQIDEVLDVRRRDDLLGRKYSPNGCRAPQSPHHDGAPTVWLRNGRPLERFTAVQQWLPTDRRRLLRLLCQDLRAELDALVADRDRRQLAARLHTTADDQATDAVLRFTTEAASPAGAHRPEPKAITGGQLKEVGNGKVGFVPSCGQ
jgi:hypothetical protein